MPSTHTIPLELRNMRGYFSPDLAPILTIDPGDSVVSGTLEAGWHTEPSLVVDGAYREGGHFPGYDPDSYGTGHAMIGPVAVRGAQPGMTLVVRVNAVVPGAWGGCYAGGWKAPVNARYGIEERGVVHAWTLDAEKLIGRSQLGHTVTLRPFLGVMGMPPPEPGRHVTTPPRAWGGNMDCKELTAGTTLYLPIPVEGALFSFGDGHAVQGDGEVSITAIECPMQQVDLTLDLRDDFPITTPHACTPQGWLTLGFGDTLDDATYAALEAMFALIQKQYGVERLDAIALASLTVDLRITQIVNDVVGVHAFLPHGAIR
ncbi:MAG: acetamidase/formamidase family protein [Anaerolineae bacterium]